MFHYGPVWVPVDVLLNVGPFSADSVLFNLGLLCPSLIESDHFHPAIRVSSLSLYFH